MRAKIYCAVGVLGILTVLAPNRSLAADSDPQGWTQTELNHSDFANLIETSNCYVDERTFRGCMAAIENLWQVEFPDAILLPTSSIRKLDHVIANFGEIQLVEIEKPAPLPSTTRPPEFLAHLRHYFQSFLFEWDALFAATKGYPIEIEGLATQALKSALSHVDERIAFADAINAYLAVTGDPHTRILPSVRFEKEMDQGHEIQFAGIGAIVAKKKDSFLIQSPIKNGPAYKAGIYANDELIRINGKSIFGLSMNDVRNRLMGPVGTWVRLDLKRKNRHYRVQIQRKLVQFYNSESSVIVEGSRKYGYIKLSSFSRSACSEVTRALFGVLRQGIKGVILDLRDNPGGTIDQAVCIADLFLPAGKTVTEIRSLDSEQKAFHQTSNVIAIPIPLTVLVNSQSASASELLTGALQDYGKAVVVGERTYGKGSVQISANLVSTDTVNFLRTIGRFYRPSGSSNQVVGVTPDLVAFERPGMTEDDRLATREEDEGVSVLEGDGPEWKHPYPRQLAALQFCVAESGTAKSKFATRQSAPLAPDYPVLVAQDAIDCMGH